MKEVKHTPGPWEFQKPDGVSIRHPKIYSDFGDISNASWTGDLSQVEANARLIAAAPEMLAMLQNLATSKDWYASSKVERDLDEIIAKATGVK